MTRSLSKSIPLTAAAFAVTMMAGAALPGGVTPAEARKVFIVKGGHGHHFHRRHFYAPVLFAGGYGYGGGCSWLKHKAHATGSPYWWNRYHACTGY